MAHPKRKKILIRASIAVLMRTEPQMVVYLPKTLSWMTGRWAYSNEAADGRISNPVAVSYPVAVPRGERGVRPRISSCANSW